MLEVKLRTAQAQKQFAMKTLRALFTIVRALAAGRALQHTAFVAEYSKFIANKNQKLGSARELPEVRKSLVKKGL
jgi:hypothetical protein